MNQKIKDILHNLRGRLDQVNTCYKCIVFDLKDKKNPKEEDISDLKKSLSIFNENLEKLISNLEQQK